MFFSDVFSTNTESTRERNFLLVLWYFFAVRGTFLKIQGQGVRSRTVSLTFCIALFHGAQSNFRCSRALSRYPREQFGQLCIMLLRRVAGLSSYLEYCCDGHIIVCKGGMMFFLHL